MGPFLTIHSRSWQIPATATEASHNWIASAITLKLTKLRWGNIHYPKPLIQIWVAISRQVWRDIWIPQALPGSTDWRYNTQLAFNQGETVVCYVLGTFVRHTLTSWSRTWIYLTVDSFGRQPNSGIKFGGWSELRVLLFDNHRKLNSETLLRMLISLPLQLLWPNQPPRLLNSRMFEILKYHSPFRWTFNFPSPPTHPLCRIGANQVGMETQTRGGTRTQEDRPGVE
jgi:hypothetical protein